MTLVAVTLGSTAIEDAFVYRTSLYCWTFDGDLRVYSVADIERAIVRESDAGSLLTYALFHSRGIGARADQIDAWHLRSSAEDGNRVTIDAERVPYVETRVGVDADVLLDFLIFYDRLYFATDGGLFSVEPFDPFSPPPVIGAELRLRDPCYAAEGGLGAVAASCGPKGLRLLLGEATGAASRTKRAAAVSVRAELGYGTVVNHRTRTDYEFLAGEVSDQAHGHVMTDVHRAKMARSENVRAAIGVDGIDAEFTLWDRSRLVMFSRGEVLSVSVVVADRERRLNSVRVIGRYEAGARVVSATRVGREFAVETEDGVTFVGEHHAVSADTGPVVSLRSYPRSHRYQRLVTATAKSGLWLIAATPDEAEFS